jgi:hypothetical protein
MLMNLGKYFKAPDERKRYSIDYTDWLDTGESLLAVTFEVIPIDADPVAIDGIAIETGAKGVVFYASGGISGTSYKAIATMTTSGGQVKEDTVQYTVRAP